MLIYPYLIAAILLAVSYTVKAEPAAGPMPTIPVCTELGKHGRKSGYGLKDSDIMMAGLQRVQSNALREGVFRRQGMGERQASRGLQTIRPD